METSLKNHFLIAMPGMNDPSFEATVTLVCEHSDEGAMGVVINRPMPLTLGDVLGELDLEAASSEMAARPIVAGGPVSRDRGFVVHSLPGEFESTLELTGELRVSFSLDIVNSLASLGAPARALFGLGYAGWDSGQLEREILQNAWLTTPSDAGIVYDLPFCGTLGGCSGVDWCRSQPSGAASRP